MPMLDFACCLLPARDMDFDRWSYGTIRTVKDLYSQSIFGAMQDLRCECGAVSGANTVGRVCLKCEVVVEADARSLARRRSAKIKLAYNWDHLWTGQMLRKFPILPLPFRVNEENRPNRLGRRYERLVEVNAKLTAEHPAPDTLDDPVTRSFDSQPELNEALRELFEGSQDSPPPDPKDPDSLSELLQVAIRSADPDIDKVFRACGFSFSVRCTC